MVLIASLPDLCTLFTSIYVFNHYFRHRSLFSDIFSGTAQPIKAKFYVEPPWEGGTKFDINGSGQMTKFVAMRYMVKFVRIISSSSSDQ